MASRTIKLQDLSVDQLASFKKETEGEIQQFSYSLSALNTAVAKFKANKLNIEEVAKKTQIDAESNAILVPLTSSLYVPGKIVNPDKFLCDIGTGYYVEMTGEKAKKFYDAKITKLGTDSKKINEILQQKSELLKSIDTVFQSKLTELQQGKK